MNDCFFNKKISFYTFDLFIKITTENLSDNDKERAKIDRTRRDKEWQKSFGVKRVKRETSIG